MDLFHRVHRGVELTSAGEELYLVLAQSFQQTAATLERIRADGQDPIVTIGATTAVAALWLMPHVSSFWREHPKADNVHELRAIDVHLLVRYGTGDWPDCETRCIFRDELIPVSSPDFAAEHPNVTVKELPSLPLIQLEGVDAGWTTWREWFDNTNVSVSNITGPTFNNYMIALQAAEDGVGVALGWRKLISPLLDRGTLVPLTSDVVAAPGAFYLSWARLRELSKPTVLLRDWLVSHGDAPIGPG